MGFFKDLYNKPGPGIPKNAPQKKGLALFFEILWRELFELIKLNLLFLLFCVPIITIPAAIAAMSKVTTKMVRDENHFLWSDFTGAFHDEFLPATLGGWLLNLIMLGSVASGFFYINLSTTNKLMMIPLIITTCVSFVATVSSFYFYPMITSVDLPLKRTLKNSFLLSFVCVGPNVIAGGIFFVSTALCVMFFFPAVPVILSIGCALLNFICTFVAYGGISKYVLQEAEEEA